MDASIRVKRADLIAKLQAKADEIKAAYQVKVDEYQALIDSKYDHATAVREWYLDVAKMIKKGEIAVSAAGGLSAGSKAVPAKPKKDANLYDKQNATYYRDLYREYQNRDTLALRTAIEMLEMSGDEFVNVATGDYQKLLSVTPPRY